MTKPYILHKAQVAGVPMLLDSPHSGTNYPADFKYMVPKQVLESLEDKYVQELFGAGPSLGASFLEATFPRSYIDPNRKLSDLDPSMVEGGWTYVPFISSRYNRTGKGLIWKEAYTYGDIYQRQLTKDEVKNRIDSYYKPYHDVLKSELHEVFAQYGVVYHVNCHSMPGISSGGELDEKGTKRPDVVVSDRFGKTCDTNFTKFIASAFEHRGLSVSENAPYQGGEIVAGYGKPDLGMHSVQIELNRDLYMDPHTFEKTDGFDTLHVIVSDVLSQIAEYAKAHIPVKQLPKGLKERRKSAI